MLRTLRSIVVHLVLITSVATGLGGCVIYPNEDEGYRHHQGYGYHHYQYDQRHDYRR